MNVVGEGATPITEVAAAVLLRGDPATPEFLPLVLFLTDGLPTVGERNEVRIHARLAGWLPVALRPLADSR